MTILLNRQCGALAEFAIIDRRRLHRCPPPTPGLGVEQLALLAGPGLAAHRAIGTYLGPVKGIKALVLHGHTGVGALAVQELVSLGALVSVQIPEDAEALKHAKALGVKAVKVGTPLQVIGSLANDDKFDFIIDTVGGKDIWHACRRAFDSAGLVSLFSLRHSFLP